MAAAKARETSDACMFGLRPQLGAGRWIGNPGIERHRYEPNGLGIPLTELGLESVPPFTPGRQHGVVVKRSAVRRSPHR